ncbi:threonine aldolase family protein [Sphingopyxis panaciterrae]|uniref:threonine aldolase family protein n=1 Tax=Sphingopyxis panaciterrae TaxID=363841 RepID=UPI0014204D8E|nr:aminotransferase class I/II-fold pyridoxal phosphate-dependent enzyme [Sphingopyxis panaciterrae]
MTEDEQALRLGCAHILPGHKTVPVPGLLQALAAHPAAQRQPDFYGSGGAVSELEERTAALLGKERGLFVIKGVTAQFSVLRRYAEQAGTDNVAIHPLSHIDVDELNGLERVAGLAPVRLGSSGPFLLRDVERISDPLAAIVVELPLRRAGYLLPPLDELKAISAWCRSRDIPLHFDGARLWEAAAGYGIALRELADLADSIYVSFYKGMGGLGGAVVAGSGDFIASLGTWKARFGGNLFTAFPYALSALSGLDHHLPAMPDYVARAREMAAKLSERFLVNPMMPHANAFQLILPGKPEGLTTLNRRFAAEKGVWLFNTVVTAPLAGHAIAEVVIGDNSRSHTAADAVGWIEAFIEEARAEQGQE